MKSFHFIDYSNCILEVSKGGKMSVISGLKGYVASPCLYSLTNNLHEKGDGNHFLLGKISGTAGKDCGYIKKSHCSCLGTVAENKAGQLYCLTCKSSELLKLDSKGHAVSFSTHDSFVPPRHLHTFTFSDLVGSPILGKDYLCLYACSFQLNAGMSYTIASPIGTGKTQSVQRSTVLYKIGV